MATITPTLASVRVIVIGSADCVRSASCELFWCYRREIVIQRWIVTRSLGRKNNTLVSVRATSNVGCWGWFQFGFWSKTLEKHTTKNAGFCQWYGKLWAIFGGNKSTYSLPLYIQAANSPRVTILLRVSQRESCENQSIWSKDKLQRGQRSPPKPILSVDSKPLSFPRQNNGNIY